MTGGIKHKGHHMEALVLNRIHDLLTYRRWFRVNRWATWTEERRAYETELRALVRLARQHRKAASAVDRRTRLYCPRHLRWERLEADGRPVPEVEPEQADPITAALGWHDWQAVGPR